MMNWASMATTGYSRDEAQPESRAAGAGTVYPIAGTSLVKTNNKGWPIGIESRTTRTINVELRDETGKAQETPERAESAAPIRLKERAWTRSEAPEPKARTRSPAERDRREPIRWPRYSASDDSSARSTSNRRGKGRDWDRGDDREDRYSWMPAVPKFREGMRQVEKGRGKGSLLERTRAQRAGHALGPETEDDSAMSEALNPEFKGTDAMASTARDPGTETEEETSETSTGEAVRPKGKGGRPLVW